MSDEVGVVTDVRVASLHVPTGTGYPAGPELAMSGETGWPDNGGALTTQVTPTPQIAPSRPARRKPASPAHPVRQKLTA